MVFIRAYLRASDRSQDAERARGQLETWCSERGLKIAAWYVENESGTIVERPELMRLLKEAHPGDVLVCEQVDRLARLTSGDWETLKAEVAKRQVRIVALDLPTSWAMLQPNPDEFTARMFGAINAMMLDMLAAIARKDYEDRRRRQKQGIEKAKAAGLYRGRREDAGRNASIARMLRDGWSYRNVQDATGAAPATVAKVAKRVREAGPV